MTHAILLLSASDQKGITAAVTDFVFRRGGNIIDADQHADKDANIFFMRVKWELDGFNVAREHFAEEFKPIADRFHMKWELYFDDRPLKVAIFVSKHLHCLHDLVYRHQHGQLPCSIDLVVSNHLDAKDLAHQSGVEFVHSSISPETKTAEEARQIGILKDKNIDLVVLARYHQILTPDFVRHFPNRIINIHHSFLPAFVGASPYAQAYAKGVKIIGATSHYVTGELDQGPIIEQDTARVNHKYSIEDLVRLGQDLERMVLFRAIRWHLEHKVLSYGNKTVVFE